MLLMAQALGKIDEPAQQMRALVEAALAEYTNFDRGCPEHLQEAIRYSLLAPAKRLRPLLVLWACEACRGDVHQALPAACAVEMVHTYSLIHDDLPAMDDDDLRRGRPTCHKQFGEGVAVLAGDALLALAFEVLSEDIEPAQSAAICCGLLAHAAGATELVGGQADDLAGEFFSGGLDVLESIHRRKTGAMFCVSLQLGAVCAGASDRQREALDEYGKHLGLAFQIVDDLLDVQGDTTKLGKKTNKDADRGKLTFPGVIGIEESRRRAESLVNAACAALEPFGSHAGSLEGLARYVLDRSS
jgi:geranylgeranyl diphosphate synthase type II